MPFRSRTPPAHLGIVSLATALALVVLPGCNGDGGTGPDGLRFGQIGEVRVRIVAPKVPDGRLEQELVWRSDGPWRLEERILYDDVLGDRTVVSENRNPESLAGEYAIWITQVNESPDLKLFIDELDPDLDPECGVVELTLTIRDEVRDETVSWTRCVTSSLGSLTTQNSGPEASAARVAQAAILLRQPTVGESFTSVYQDTAPFATVAKGEDSEAVLPEPRTILDANEWAAFWSEHTGGSAAPPPVDFERDLVIVAAVGERQEAGDSVEVRSVLPLGSRTLVRIVERVPGDFCSPVARTHTSFHIVRAPRAHIPLPVEFIEAESELVPCGL